MVSWIRTGYPLVIATLLATVSGVAFSTFYWRYPFSPPAVLPELRDLHQLEQLTWVARLHPDLLEDLELRALEQLPPEKDLRDFPPHRVLQALQRQQLSPNSAQPVDAELALQLWSAAEASSLLLSGEPGYRATKELRGYIGTVVTSSGQRMALASLIGSEHSNDHYPYYEFVVPLDGKPQVQNALWYFHDIAGIEGVTWWFVAIFLFVVTYPLVFVGAILVREWRAA